MRHKQVEPPPRWEHDAVHCRVQESARSAGIHLLRQYDVGDAEWEAALGGCIDNGHWHKL